MVHIFYHVWAHNHWREILLEHLRILQRQRHMGHFTIGLIGNSSDVDFITHMLDAHELSGTIVDFGINHKQFEFPTLKLLEASVNAAPSDNYFYFHTKGVSSRNDCVSTSWRWYLNMFLLGQMVNLIPKLQTHDLIGACWGNHFAIGPHFPGNFWFGRGDYLKSLIAINDHIQNGYDWLKRPEIKGHNFLGIRHAAETWVGQNNPRVFEAGHDRTAMIWDKEYWSNNPELQKYVAIEGLR